jgi:hypothetical protein
MTVKELKNALKQFPEELIVLTDGYEDGYEKIVNPKIIDVTHQINNPYYSGEYKLKEEKDTDLIKAVAILRNRRDD